MNSTSEAADAPEPVQKPKKQISAQRRIITWIFIAILLGVVLLEWRAKTSQATTFENLNSAMEEAGNVGEISFEEFQTIKQGSPSEELDDSGALLRLFHYRWNGPFKVYHLRLLVNDEDQVIAYDTSGEGEEVGGIVRLSKKKMAEFVKQQRNEIQGQPDEKKSAEKKQTEPTKEESGDATKK